MAIQAPGSYASIQEEIVANTLGSAAGETLQQSQRARLGVTDQVEHVPAPARMRVVGGRSREANVPRVARGAGLVSPGAVRWALETVKQLVSEFYGIPVAELVGQERTADLVYARHMAMAVSRDVTPAGLVQVGRTYARDHTTVLHALKKMKATCRREPMVAEERASLRQAAVEVLTSRSVTARAAAAGTAVRHL